MIEDERTPVTIHSQICSSSKTVAIALGLAFATFVSAQSVNDTSLSWKGHSIGEWMEIYGKYKYTSKPWATQQEIEDAIRHFGTSSLPFLLQRIAAEQSESALEGSPEDQRQSYQALGAVAA